MTPERYQRLRETLDRRQPDLTVVTDGIHKMRNVAAITRTCDAVGIGDMHVVVPEGGFQRRRGASQGSERWVNMRVHDTAPPLCEQLKSQGHQLVAAHFTEAAIDFREVDYTRPTALIMGNEKLGVRDAIHDYIDHYVVVPMMGMVESLNVSVAAAVILSEAQHQRQKAGLYDECHLPSDVYWDLFFRWAHPKIARYCEERRLPFPPLREDGEIEQPAAWYHSVRKR